MPKSKMKKQALLIGINQYEILPELKFARQDAEAVEQSLKQNYSFLDDEVMLLTDAKPGLFKPMNKHVIQTHLENLANQELDLFIFGFWGHGLFRNGERYLCPLDVMNNAVEELGFSFRELQYLLSKINAKNTCLILDCCQTIHDRGELEMLTTDDLNNLENVARDIILRRKEQRPGFQSNVAILNSCKEGQSAYEWDARQHGIFTAHLLDAFNRRYESVAQIVAYVSKNVEKTAMGLGKTQTPFSKLEGDIILPVNTESVQIVTGDVFISYRHCNANLVAPVEAELKRRGISYFIDRIGINNGKYSKVITKAISDCKLLLLFWTSDVNGSEDIVNEVVLALKLKKAVLPYKIGKFNELDHRELCYHLASLSRCDAPSQTPETVVAVVNRIEQAISGKAVPDKTNLISKRKSVFSWKSLIAALLVVAFVLYGIWYHNADVKKKAENLYNQAVVFRNAGDYNNAMKIIDEALDIYPDNIIFQTEKQTIKADNLYHQAVASRIAGDYNNAMKIVDEALNIYPNNIVFQTEKQTIINAIDSSKHPKTEKTANDSFKPTGLSQKGTKPGERRIVTIKGAEFAFRWCPPGTFMMGSPELEKARYRCEKQHQVTIKKGFWMMEKEVTQKQWMAVMGKNPSYFKGENLPVEQVSWKDCQDFCIRCCSLIGLSVKLPTEAQWEYACRAGSSTSFSWGKSLNGDKANCAGNYPYGTTTRGKYLKKTTPVGKYPPNSWGLYDMHGNVWEWCSDWYGVYPSRNVSDPTGPSNGSYRVYRGGSWYVRAKYCRAAYRNDESESHYDNSIGLRCVVIP